MTFNTVENDITPILKRSKAARCDDMVLYANYAYEKIAGFNYGAGWLEKVFSDRRFRLSHGIAPYETVSRVRRKLQAANENLRPTIEDIDERKRAEKEYKDYAKRKGAVE